MQPDPQVILIGFNRCGGGWFKRVFGGAGLNFRHDRTGDLATDLAYSEAVGRTPFLKWPRLDGISGLERWNRQDMPLIEGNGAFAFLHQHFPDARFILNDRAPADWIAARFFHRDGRYREMAAWHHGVEERDLPKLWLEQRAAHIEAVTAYFGDSPRFLHFDVTADPGDKLRDWAAGWLDLPPLPDDRGIETAQESIIQIDMLAEQIAELAEKPRRPRRRPDMGFVDGVIAHCLGAVAEGVALGDNAVLSGQAAFWDGDGPVRGRDGAVLPVARHPGGAFMAEERDPPLTRVQGVLNDFARLGLVPPVAMDMLDARPYGIGDRPGPAQATLVYCRRPGAANMVLWPLPGYHDLAPTGAPGGYMPDDIPFDEKADTCAWLGNLTGRPLLSRLPPGLDDPQARILLDELAAGVPEGRRAEIEGQLAAIPRYRVVSRLFGQPGFDLGFVLPPKHEKAGRDPLIAPYVVGRRPSNWSHGARYVLSLSGNDTGSNFLPAAASNSLVLKEEDGWELFYTGAFRPWEHYLPLAPGADDLETRLDWARSHPGKCTEMIRASNALFEAFAAPENRDAWLRGLWEEVRARR